MVGKARRTGRRPKLVRLEHGKRPFLAVSEVLEAPIEGDPNTYTKGWHGWVFPYPNVDDADTILREAGLQAEQRRQPCFLFVSADKLEE